MPNGFDEDDWQVIGKSEIYFIDIGKDWAGIEFSTLFEQAKKYNLQNIVECEVCRKLVLAGLGRKR